MLRSCVLRLSVRRFSTEVVKPVVAPEQKAKKCCSILTRFRSFASGALFASAVGMYVITFQLQGLLDEVKAAVHDVSARQRFIDEKVQSLQRDVNNMSQRDQ